jgi:protein-S-isoprenylcysteine O-methyltransferase Ste14
MTAVPIASPPTAAPSKFENFLVKYRVHVGFLIAAGVLIEGVLEKELPLDWRKPAIASFVAIPLILAGFAVRFISLGTIRKNEALATKGIYSRCRHPLYFGSALLFVGLGLILNDAGYEFWYLGVPYLLLFYSAAVRKEERFLRDKFGAEFDTYKATTPAFFPYGKYVPGEFSAARAFQKGGTKLCVSVALMLIAMQAMVYVLPKL